MRKCKKVLAVLLVLTMVLAMAACGNSATNNETPAPGTTAAPGTDAAPEETDAPTPAGDPVYINENAATLTGSVRFYTPFGGSVGTDALIEEFNQYYPNIEVTYEVYKNNGDGNVGLDTAMRAGEVDVALLFGLNNTEDRWENGLLMDLTDRMAADNLDLKTEWGTDTYTYNGRTYVIPSGGICVFVVINLDRWEEAGLGELPTEWTWDEYMDACRKMTKDGVMGGALFNTTEYMYFDIRQQKGHDAFYNEEGLSDFDNPMFAEALQREIDAEKEGIWYPKTDMIANNEKTRELFLTGKIASATESIVIRYIMQIEHDFRIGFAPYPVVNEGETNYMAGISPYSYLGIASNCQDDEAAYAFAKFAATYGNKYMFAAGHSGTWRGNETDNILPLIFGSMEEAEKQIDVESYNRVVLALDQPFYTESNITAFSEVYDTFIEYGLMALRGEMSPEEAMAEAKTYADDAIREKLGQ